MTPNQLSQFNRMRDALLQIAGGYQTPEEIRKSCEVDYGLDFEEAIEMAYSNIQATAAGAVRGVREAKAKG